MGQRIMNSRSDFFLPRDKKDEARDALRRLFGPAGAHVTSLDEALALASFEVTEDEDGNVDDLFLATEYLDPDDTEALKIIAPFVRPGSYVMFVGTDDAEQWAWVFREHADTREMMAFEETVIPLLESEYGRLRAAAGARPGGLPPVSFSSGRLGDDVECDGP